jgi:hypothetical protein
MAMQINSVRVDRQMFQALLFLGCEAKREFGKESQATTKAGQLKWEIQALAVMTDNFGKSVKEVLSVGINSSTNPGDGLTELDPIDFGDLTCGFMPKAKKNQDGSERPIPGISVFFSATEVLNARETVIRQPEAA